MSRGRHRCRQRLLHSNVKRLCCDVRRGACLHSAKRPRQRVQTWIFHRTYMDCTPHFQDSQLASQINTMCGCHAIAPHVACAATKYTTSITQHTLCAINKSVLIRTLRALALLHISILISEEGDPPLPDQIHTDPLLLLRVMVRVGVSE